MRLALDRLPGGTAHLVCALAAAVVITASITAGVNLIDLTMDHNASLTNMVPRGDHANGQLECWLTLEFKHYPKDADLRDVKIRFESIALAEAAEFDWAFIAGNDKIARGQPFPMDYREAEMTSPDRPPPLGEPVKIRFPLQAKQVIEDAPLVLYLEADLYWGGVKQDSLRAKIEHVYSRSAQRPPQ